MRGAKHKEVFEISDLRRREILHLRSVCPPGCVCVGGGGYSYIYIHTQARTIFLWFKILNFNIFFFRKLNIFGV